MYSFYDFSIEWFAWDRLWKQVSTIGQTMRPSHLFGQCGCRACELAVFAGRKNQRRHCVECGFCMFVLCPATFVYAWDKTRRLEKRYTYDCTIDARELYACERRQRENTRFMLWLCWTRGRRTASPSGLGTLPREVMRIIGSLLNN
jgi:hypothetical protein